MVSEDRHSQEVWLKLRTGQASQPKEFHLPLRHTLTKLLTLRTSSNHSHFYEFKTRKQQNILSRMGRHHQAPT